mmetsp:Transcript_16102/g.40389  ORF Transcript_16102/g.40389 Transcript_16102/m.40389 type:complete len:403 (+) Transcript_16102:2591-3799(+)
MRLHQIPPFKVPLLASPAANGVLGVDAIVSSGGSANYAEAKLAASLSFLGAAIVNDLVYQFAKHGAIPLIEQPVRRHRLQVRVHGPLLGDLPRTRRGIVQGNSSAGHVGGAELHALHDGVQHLRHGCAGLPLVHLAFGVAMYLEDCAQAKQQRVGMDLTSLRGHHGHQRLHLLELHSVVALLGTRCDALDDGVDKQSPFTKRRIREGVCAPSGELPLMDQLLDGIQSYMDDFGAPGGLAPKLESLEIIVTERTTSRHCVGAAQALQIRCARVPEILQALGRLLEYRVERFSENHIRAAHLSGGLCSDHLEGWPGGLLWLPNLLWNRQVATGGDGSFVANAAAEAMRLWRSRQGRPRQSQHSPDNGSGGPKSRVALMSKVGAGRARAPHPHTPAARKREGRGA